VKKAAWFALLLLLCPPACSHSHPVRFRFAWARVRHKLHGQLLDFTNNHGADRRIWSESLQQKRDMYVYLPPGFDPCCRYPLMIWLHGFAQDEYSFLADVVGQLDKAIADGVLPPMIIAAPDGSLQGNSCFFTAGSFFLNTKAGCFENYLMHDVWDFLFQNFPIRPERHAHVMAGVSMGGGAAFNKAIKFRDRIGVVLGVFPPVNVRWMDCRGRYMGNFDPCCWAWKTDYNHPWQVVGRFYGVFTIRERNVVQPLYGKGDPNVAGYIAAENPIEMIDAYCLRDGELAIYIAYGGKDQFNIDAQVRARERGLCVAVGYDPKGKHDRATAYRLMPAYLAWLGQQLAPWGPCCPGK
jgi:S-formylglutathione hydrolase FrmB